MMNYGANKMSGWAGGGQNMSGMGFGLWHIIGAIFAVAVVIAVIVIAIKLLKGQATMKSTSAQQNNRVQEDDAMRVLRLRYAQGEISHEEFVKRRTVLEGGVVDERANKEESS